MTAGRAANADAESDAARVRGAWIRGVAMLSTMVEQYDFPLRLHLVAVLPRVFFGTAPAARSRPRRFAFATPPISMLALIAES